MNTNLFEIDPNNIDDKIISLGADLLKDGKLVAFPTETVYGLGANGLDEVACLDIYKAKGRPSDNPLILHISNLEQLNTLVLEISPIAQKIIDTFLPAPLTLIFKKSKIVPYVVSGGLDTVAVRFPKNPIANALIEKAGIPIAAPSANLSGKPSCTKASHVKEDLFGKISLIIDGGECSIGLESTILDTTTTPPTLLRPGFITLEQLTEVIGDIAVDKTLMSKVDDGTAPKAPGMKYVHYSPNADVILVDCNSFDYVEKINSVIEEYKNKGQKVGVLTTNQHTNSYVSDVIMSLGDENHLDEIGSNLFSMLREMDAFEVDVIFVKTFSETEKGLAIMNRLKKASGYNVIKL